jgi:hypothetical protein
MKAAKQEARPPASRRPAILTEAEIAPLREEVRRAGWRAYRLGIRAVKVIAASGGLVALASLICAWGWDIGLAWFYLGLNLAVTAVAAIFVGGTVAELCARRYRWRLLRQVEALSPAERAELLLPLKHDTTGETSFIVEPLVRELERAGELVAVAGPEGRGNEPAAGELA